MSALSQESIPASKVGEKNWKQIQRLVRASLILSLRKRSVDQIDELVHADDLGHFTRERLDPKNDLTSFYLPVSYTRPRVSLVRSGDEILGYANSVDASMGWSTFSRQLTLRGGFKAGERYRLIRELAVIPHARGEGIGRMLGNLAISGAHCSQTVVSSIWNEDNLAISAAMYAGMKPHTGVQNSYALFGYDQTPVRVQRYSANVGSVRSALNRPVKS